MNSPVVQDASLGGASARRSCEFEYVEADSESYEENSDSEVGNEACRAEEPVAQDAAFGSACEGRSGEFGAVEGGSSYDEPATPGLAPRDAAP